LRLPHALSLRVRGLPRRRAHPAAGGRRPSGGVPSRRQPRPAGRRLMLLFTASRLLRAGLTILFVMTFAFVVLRLSGDPALLIMSVDAPPEAIKAFREGWGLDRPIWDQYLAYLGHAVTAAF